MRSLILAQLLVLIVLGAALGGYVWADRQSRVYGGRAEILYEGQDDSSAAEGERQMATQKALLTSALILAPAAHEFRTTVDDLIDDVYVSVDAGSNVLQLTVASPSSATAVAMTRAIADTYVDYVGDRKSPETQKAKRLLDQRIKRLAARLSIVQKSRVIPVAGLSTPTSFEQEQSLVETQSLLGRIGSLQESLTELEVAEITGAGAQMLSPAHLLANPLEPEPLRTAAAGGLAGLFIAGIVLLVAARSRLTE